MIAIIDTDEAELRKLNFADSNFSIFLSGNFWFPYSLDKIFKRMVSFLKNDTLF